MSLELIHPGFRRDAAIRNFRTFSESIRVSTVTFSKHDRHAGGCGGCGGTRLDKFRTVDFRMADPSLRGVSAHYRVSNRIRSAGYEAKGF
jgi:hypothetical protein